MGPEILHLLPASGVADAASPRTRLTSRGLMSSAEKKKKQKKTKPTKQKKPGIYIFKNSSDKVFS